MAGSGDSSEVFPATPTSGTDGGSPPPPPHHFRLDDTWSEAISGNLTISRVVIDFRQRATVFLPLCYIFMYSTFM